MSSLTFALKNMRRNRLRSVVTVLGVASLLFLVSLLVAIVVGLQGTTTESASSLRLVTRNKVSLTFWLPEAYWAKIQALPHVKVVCPSNWFQGTYIDQRHFFARFMVDPETLMQLHTDDWKTDPAQIAAWKADRQGALVARALAEREHWKLGDKITIKGDIYPVDVELNIDAMYDGGIDEAVFFHRLYVEEAMGRPGRVGTYTILVDALPNLSAVAQQVDAMFADSDRETKTETESAFRAGFVSMMGNVKGLMTNLTLIIAVTIMLTAGNTMAMATRERAREMAVLKALGFMPARILALVVAESAAMAALAGLVGVGGFWSITYWLFVVKQIRLPMVWYPLTLTPPYGIGLLLGTLLLGVAAGLVPGLVASRVSIVDGLRAD